MDTLALWVGFYLAIGLFAGYEERAVTWRAAALFFAWPLVLLYRASNFILAHDARHSGDDRY